MYRKKYQQEPAHCGIVLVSLSPIILPLESLTSTQFFIFAKGDSPVPAGSYFSTSGNKSGKSSSFNALDSFST